MELVSAGNLHACAIRGDGTVWCWGFNSKGQIGDGTLENRSQPVQVVPEGVMEPTSDISVSMSEFTCATTAGMELWCWGKSGPAGGNQHEHYSDTSTWYQDPIPHPVRIGDETALTISAGGDHSCVRRVGGSGCMGANRPYGQLSRDPVPVQSYGSLQYISGAGVLSRLAAGDDHTCVVEDGDLECWGKNSSGQLGRGNTDVPTSFNSININDVGVTSWLEVGLGWSHSCAVSDVEALYCWGAAGRGQLGTGETTRKTIATQIDEGPGWTVVDGGESHTCGLKNGMLFCWGANGSGEIGDGTRVDRPVPTRIGTEEDWAFVSAGNAFSCGIRESGQLYCWGENTVGQLGIGSTDNALSPTRICLP